MPSRAEGRPEKAQKRAAPTSTCEKRESAVFGDFPFNRTAEVRDIISEAQKHRERAECRLSKFAVKTNEKRNGTRALPLALHNYVWITTHENPMPFLDILRV